jgi:hypothetical protein
MSSFSDAQLSEIASAVMDIVPIGSVMFENFEESLRGYFEAKLRAKYAPAPFMGTCVQPTSDQLKLVDFELPFIPDCVRYLGCKAIKFNRGLMTPCGAKCKNSEFCVTCLKKADKNAGAHEFGTLDERTDAFDAGEKYSAGGKSEISFGDYLHLIKKTREDCKLALREGGSSLNIPERCFARTSTEKKRSGRPKKADESSIPDPEVAEPPKPKAKKNPLSLEEKIAKLKEDAEKKAIKDKETAEKKAIKDKEKAEKDAKKAAEKAEKAEKDAKEPKEPKKPKKTAEKVSQLLNQLEEADKADKAESVSPKNSPKNSPTKHETVPEPDDDDDNDDDNSSLNGDNDVSPPTETVKVKGVKLIRKLDDNSIYAEEDEELETPLGVWIEASETVSFNKSRQAKMNIEEQVAARFRRSLPANMLASSFPSSTTTTSFTTSTMRHSLSPQQSPASFFGFSLMMAMALSPLTQATNALN